MNSEEHVLFILGQFNTGLRTEWTLIEELETNLEKDLRDVKARGDPHIPPGSRGAWDRAWSQTLDYLAGIRSCVAEARRRFDSGDAVDALESWVALIDQNRALDRLLKVIRRMGTQAALPEGESGAWDDAWELLWTSIGGRLEILRAHAVATRFRLEMRQKYGAARADALTREILDHLPPDATLEQAEKFTDAYRRAHREFQKHLEHPTIRDIIRGLFLLPEKTPDDHMPPQRRPRRRKLQELQESKLQRIIK